MAEFTGEAVDIGLAFSVNLTSKRWPAGLTRVRDETAETPSETGVRSREAG